MSATPAAAQEISPAAQAHSQALDHRQAGEHALAARAFRQAHDADLEAEFAYTHLVEAAREWALVPGYEVEALALLDRVLSQIEHPYGRNRRIMRQYHAEAQELRQEIVSGLSSETLRAREDAHRLLQEANDHQQQGRIALAAQSYADLYDVMLAARFPRASIALWNLGLVLSQVPAQEREAVDALRRFLEQSTALADHSADVTGWRSDAVSLIRELEARAPAADHLDAPSGGGGEEEEPSVAPAAEGISPVGPILLSVGGAALVAGAAVGIVVLVQDGDLAAMCSDSRCPADAQDLAASIEGFALATDVLLVAGAVVAAAGLVLTFTLTESTQSSVSVGVGPLGAHIQGAF